jgi:hypothetical protein
MVWLTLVAFSVQLAVAVLHHHNHNISGHVVATSTCPSASSDSCNPLQNHSDHDGCILCWATAVASASLAPLVLELSKPQQLAGVRLTVSQSGPTHVIHRDYFQARGPPGLIFS